MLATRMFIRTIANTRCGRIGKQTEHLANHTELNALGLKCKPKSTSHQSTYKHIAPDDIVDMGEQIVHG